MAIAEVRGWVADGALAINQREKWSGFMSRLREERSALGVEMEKKNSFRDTACYSNIDENCRWLICKMRMRRWQEAWTQKKAEREYRTAADESDSVVGTAKIQNVTGENAVKMLWEGNERRERMRNWKQRRIVQLY